MIVKEKVVFRLSPEVVQSATRVMLFGDFNEWNQDNGIELYRVEDGSFITELELESGEYQYKYFLNDGRWVNDHNETVGSPAFGDSIRNCYIRVDFVPAEAPQAGNQNHEAFETAAPAEAPAKKVSKSSKKGKVTEEGPGSESTQFVKQFHDLTIMEGVTPQVQELLYNHDIRTFGLIAKLSGKKLNEILRSGGPAFDGIKADKWPKAAKEISAKMTAKANDEKKKKKK